jgi:hypothetical protein
MGMRRRDQDLNQTIPITEATMKTNIDATQTMTLAF